ncbi:MAG: SMC-Scp complex subunit ScpB [Parachlamydiaceae bacterium]
MNREINLLESLMSYTEENEPVTDSTEMTEESSFLEQQHRQHVKGIIEALLFSSSTPLAFNKIREVTDSVASLRPKVLREILEELQYDYISQQRAFRLEEIAQGFILRTCEEYAPYIDLMLRNKRAEKLSQASAEVLAIIAYKQPITRPQIDAIRGVDSSGTVQNLLERQLIEPLGKLEAPGRPMLYGITKEFLLHFGLRDLKDLPKMSEEKII